MRSLIVVLLILGLSVQVTSLETSLIKCGLCEMSMNFLSKLANNDFLVDLAVGILKIGMRPYFHPDKIKELTEWYIPVVVKGGRRKLFNT